MKDYDEFVEIMNSEETNEEWLTLVREKEPPEELVPMLNLKLSFALRKYHEWVNS